MHHHFFSKIPITILPHLNFATSTMQHDLWAHSKMIVALALLPPFPLIQVMTHYLQAISHIHSSCSTFFKGLNLMMITLSCPDLMTLPRGYQLAYDFRFHISLLLSLLIYSYLGRFWNEEYAFFLLLFLFFLFFSSGWGII